MEMLDIIPLIVGIFAFLTGLIALWKGTRKAKADAAESVTNAAVALMGKYDDRLDRLEKTVEKQAAKIEKLELWRRKTLRGVLLLCNQIRGLGYEPVWEPDEEDLG